MTREEAREILTHNWTRVDNPNYSESELDEAFFMAIEALSEDKTDRPTGEWIESELDKGFRVCSVCKNKDYKDKMAWRTDFIKSYLNFCPNCGAIMKGGAE